MENKRENFDNLVKTLSKSSEENQNSEKISKNKEKTVKISEENYKIFQKFKIKDIVFLAIISCIMLLTGAFMPLVSNIPLFGIIQICS